MCSQNLKEPAGCRRSKGAKLGVPGEDAARPLRAGATPSHGTSSGINLYKSVKPQFLDRIQERDQVGHFFLRQIHLETLVVEIQQLSKVSCAALLGDTHSQLVCEGRARSAIGYNRGI